MPCWSTYALYTPMIMLPYVEGHCHVFAVAGVRHLLSGDEYCEASSQSAVYTCTVVQWLISCNDQSCAVTNQGHTLLTMLLATLCPFGVLQSLPSKNIHELTSEHQVSHAHSSALCHTVLSLPVSSVLQDAASVVILVPSAEHAACSRVQV